jgi:Rrf2 family transcriptional regulator, cysteine metabolism repressor
MKISTKGQYVLEALIDLQLHAVDGQESLKNVALRRGISEPYLDQIFNTLRKAGIVESIRGAQGGYRLMREPQAITAGDIIRSVEGPLSPVKCINCSQEDESRCPMFDRCVTRLLWAKVSSEIDSVIDGVTLGDLLDSYANIAGKDIPEYSI